MCIISCMRNSTTTNPSTDVPLARDEDGKPIDIPPDAACWRVRRHTRGRPRNVPGIDRQPLKLPLDFSEDDLHGMLGPGTYRLDLIDQAGEPLDLTVAVSVGDSEPASANQPQRVEVTEASPVLPVSASDVRLVLEANVRATQMAFQHNERTLTASLRMAETLRDGVRSLAEAQADWIKSISSARGFFRNAAPPQLAPLDESDDDDDDDDETGPAEPPASRLDKVMDVVGPFIPELMASWRAKNHKADGDPSKAMVHLARIRAHLTAAEREVLDEALADPETGEAVAADLRARSVEEAVAAIRRPPRHASASESAAVSPTDPTVMQKVAAVSTLLEPDIRARLLKLAPRVMKSPDAMQVVAGLVPLSNEAAAEWLRSNIGELETRFAS